MTMTETPRAGPGDPGADVSVVLAVLNERENLPDVVARILAQPLGAMEVIVVDDGSTDGTRAYLKTVTDQDRRVRAILHEGRQTTLRAQCQGIDAARGSYVVVMDADRQHPPETIPALVSALRDGASLTVASRYAPGGTAGPRTVGRFLVSKAAEWFARLLLPAARSVSDPVSGFFAFRRSVWSGLDASYRGYKLLLFVLAMAGGRRVSEVAFVFEPRRSGTSKVTESYSFATLFVEEVFLARRLGRQISAAPPPVPAARRIAR